MAMMRSIQPVFPVTNLDRAVGHYESLGFSVRRYEGGGYAYAERDGVELHLLEDADHTPTRSSSAAYLQVDDADVLAREWQGLPGRQVAAAVTPYGLREGAHVDLDGNLLRFGSPLTGDSR